MMLSPDGRLFRSPCQRHPEFFIPRGKHEFRPHDADYGVGLAVQRDLPAHDIAVACKPASPEGVGQNDLVLMTNLVLSRNKRAAQHRSDPKHGKEICANGTSAQDFGLSSS